MHTNKGTQALVQSWDINWVNPSSCLRIRMCRQIMLTLWKLYLITEEHQILGYQCSPILFATFVPTKPYSHRLDIFTHLEGPAQGNSLFRDWSSWQEHIPSLWSPIFNKLKTWVNFWTPLPSFDGLLLMSLAIPKNHSGCNLCLFPWHSPLTLNLPGHLLLPSSTHVSGPTSYHDTT